jgi:hypothetical protein
LRQTLKIGAMLLVVAALVTTGIAVAQSDDGGAVFTALEDATDSDQVALFGERPVRARILEWLAPLVEDETIAQDQAEAVADTLVDHLPRWRGAIVRGLHGLDDAADFLGMTARDLAEALRDGATLGDLAEDHGLGAEALIDHLVGLVQTHLDAAVTDGRITEEEAAEHLARATEHITDLVNGVLERPLLGEGFGGGPGFGRHGGGMGGGPCQDAGSESGLTEPGA